MGSRELGSRNKAGRLIGAEGGTGRTTGSGIATPGAPFPPLTPALGFGVPYSSDFRHIWKTRSVDHVQFLPFLTTDINTLSWLSYGALKGDWTVIIVNAVGTALQTLYVLMYLHFCPRKRTVLLQTAALLGILFLAFSYFWLLVPEEQQLQQLGLFCCICTISMYLSPMADLAKIIHTKSTKGLSWPLTIASLLSSSCWSFYGLRFQDPYITVPNLPGILTSLLRLWLFWKYPQERDRNYQLLQT